ncbi:MAG TPA: hypothetical protein VM327_08270 [Candidatus Thermoplasmatota archaeon]|nr:hypothetical protein [Candidatus Thermoplasmatota archaeon]
MAAQDDGHRYLPDLARSCGITDLDVTQYDLVGVSSTGQSPPDLPAGVKVLTFSPEVWKCFHPEENVPSDEPTIQEAPGMVAPPPVADLTAGPAEVHALWGPANSPRAGNHAGAAVYTIVLPNVGDSLYPSNGCNLDATTSGLNDLKNNVVGGSFTLYCYYLPLWSTGGNTDANTLLNQVNNAVNNNYGYMVDSSWELVIGMVKKASNIGIAAQPGQSSVVAEVRTDGWDAPHHSVVMHEVGHNWGASHYPSETWKYVCQFTVSDMNYCSMQFGATHFDSGNKNTAYNRYWLT